MNLPTWAAWEFWDWKHGELICLCCSPEKGPNLAKFSGQPCWGATVDLGVRRQIQKEDKHLPMAAQNTNSGDESHQSSLSPVLSVPIRPGRECRGLDRCETGRQGFPLTAYIRGLLECLALVLNGWELLIKGLLSVWLGGFNVIWNVEKVCIPAVIPMLSVWAHLK